MAQVSCLSMRENGLILGTAVLTGTTSYLHLLPSHLTSVPKNETEKAGPKPAMRAKGHQTTCPGRIGVGTGQAAQESHSVELADLSRGGPPAPELPLTPQMPPLENHTRPSPGRYGSKLHLCQTC
jgi:hypothetical protein